MATMYLNTIAEHTTSNTVEQYQFYCFIMQMILARNKRSVQKAHEGSTKRGHG